MRSKSKKFEAQKEQPKIIPTDTIKLLADIELSIDLLIRQLIQFKDIATKLRQKPEAVSTQFPLSDFEIQNILQKRRKTIEKGGVKNKEIAQFRAQNK